MSSEELIDVLYNLLSFFIVSPKVQLCLNKEKSFISFSKCISFEEDAKKLADVQIINEETEKNPSRSRNSDECLALQDLEAIEEITPFPRSKSATNFVVLSLLDSGSGKVIPLQDAINKQIVDHRNSTYRDTVTGSLMSLSEAAMKGKAFIRPLEDAQISFNNKVVDNIVTELKKSPRVTCRLPASQSNINSIALKDPMIKTTKHSIKDLEKFVDPQKLSTRSFEFLESSFCFPIGDTTTKSNALTVHQALCRGILTFNSITLCRDGGKVEVKSLQEAASLGLMDMEVYEGLLRIAEEHSLDNFIKSSSAKSCKNVLESSPDANSDRMYKRIPAPQDKSLLTSDDCCLDSLSRLEADNTFVTDLTNRNEVISISAWLKNSQKSSGCAKLQRKTEHVRNTRTQSKNLSNLPSTRAIKMGSTAKQTQRNDSKKLPSASPAQRPSNKTQINTQQTKEDASCHKHLEPVALQSLKNALINQKLSAQVFSEENVERVKALKFLKGQNIDVEKDLLMEIKDCTNISCSSKLPKLKNDKTGSKTLAASSPESKLGSSNSLKSLSVRDAILSGKLDLNTGNLTSGTSSFSIYQPCQSNVKLNEQVVAQILNAVAGNSLGQLLCVDNILPNFDVKSLRDFCPISLERSVKEGLIDPTTVFVFNSNTGTLQSLKAAVKCGSFDFKSSCFLKESGEKININEALASGMIKINFTPNEVQSWLSEHRGTDEKRICNDYNNHSVQLNGLNAAQQFWKKCIDDLESIEKKLKNWQSNDFDIPMIEDQLKSATDNFIMFVNSKPSPKEVAGQTNGKKGCDVEELKARLHKSWEEFENVKLNLKSKKSKNLKSNNC